MGFSDSAEAITENFRRGFLGKSSRGRSHDRIQGVCDLHHHLVDDLLLVFHSKKERQNLPKKMDPAGGRRGGPFSSDWIHAEYEGICRPASSCRSV